MHGLSHQGHNLTMPEVRIRQHSNMYQHCFHLYLKEKNYGWN